MATQSGRKEKYTTHVEPNLDTIRAWRRRGVTEEQVCKNLGISVPALAIYKKANLELVEALKKGLDESVCEVESALFRRTQGFEWEDVEEGTRNKGQDTYTKTTKHIIPPDTLACIFYLKNRKSSDWRDKQEIDHKVEAKVTLDMINERMQTGFSKFMTVITGGK